MSLLHQVLRDIDARQEHSGETPLPFMAQPFRRPVWRRRLVLLATLLLLVVLVVRFWPVSGAFIPLAVVAPPGAAEPVAAEPVVEEVTVPASALPAMSAAAELPAEALPLIIEEVPLLAETVSLRTEKAQLTQSVSRESLPAAPARVIRTGEEARQWYQKALSAVRASQWSQAGQALEQALQRDNRDEYAALNLRLYLLQQDAGGFIRYYHQEAARNSVEWLSVAAPGLHLQGFYHEAASAYQALLRLQNQPQWQLALAAALRADNRHQEARSLLQQLAPTRLSPEQRAWVQQTLNELEL